MAVYSPHSTARYRDVAVVGTIFAVVVGAAISYGSMGADPSAEGVIEHRENVIGAEHDRPGQGAPMNPRPPTLTA